MHVERILDSETKQSIQTVIGCNSSIVGLSLENTCCQWAQLKCPDEAEFAVMLRNSSYGALTLDVRFSIAHISVPDK